MASAPAETKLQRIEDKLDKAQAGAIAVTSSAGGTSFSSMAEVMEFAKLMSLADVVVPPHLRGNPGACMAVCLQAVEWRMSPFAVANKSYVVNDRISYESQLIHAVIEQRAPLVGRLRHRFVGDGAKRQCIVWALAQGESEPFEYTSPEFGNIGPKNSPLWKTKPDLQLFYNTSRDWARVYFPEVILGVYSEDELPSQPGVGLNRRGSVPMPRAIGETPVSVHASEPLSDASAIEAEVVHSESQTPGVDDEAAAAEADERLSSLQAALLRLNKPNRTHAAELKNAYGGRIWGQLTADEQADELRRLEGLMPVGV